jgi:hyaluronoglucosaminidase
LPLGEELTGVYDISWKGSVEARYVRLRKLESQKRNWLAIRSFEINAVAETEYGWDGNPFTSIKIAGGLSFELPKGGKVAYMMLGKLPKDGVICRLLDKDGSKIEDKRIYSSMSLVELNDKVYALELRGKVDLFECFIYADDEHLPIPVK